MVAVGVVASGLALDLLAWAVWVVVALEERLARVAMERQTLVVVAVGVAVKT